MINAGGGGPGLGDDSYGIDLGGEFDREVFSEFESSFGNEASPADSPGEGSKDNGSATNNGESQDGGKIPTVEVPGKRDSGPPASSSTPWYIPINIGGDNAAEPPIPIIVIRGKRLPKAKERYAIPEAKPRYTNPKPKPPYTIPKGKPPPAAKTAAFTVPKGQLTFDAEGREGGPYHSRKAHWPGGSSGVTIGRGYDMKLRTEEKVRADLIAAGVPKDQAEALAKGAGKSGSDAANFIRDPAIAKIEVTPEAQKELFNTVYETYLADVKRISVKPETVRLYGKVDFDKLDPAMLDVAVDLLYRGDYTSATRKLVQPLLVADDRQGLEALLSDKSIMVGKWGVPPDRFNLRKDYLK